MYSLHFCAHWHPALTLFYPWVSIYMWLFFVTCNSVQQLVKLFKHILDTHFASCCDVKQPGKKNCLFVGCLTSFNMRVYLRDGSARTILRAAHWERSCNQTFCLIQSQHTDTGPTSPSTVPIMPGVWQGSHWSAKFYVTGMTWASKNPDTNGIQTRDFLLSRQMP